jgi:hypothetical protein
MRLRGAPAGSQWDQGSGTDRELLSFTHRAPVRISGSQSSNSRYRKRGIFSWFLTLESLDGKIVADGEQRKPVAEIRTRRELCLDFKDGSIHNETTVFSQQAHLKSHQHASSYYPHFRRVDFNVSETIQRWTPPSAGCITSMRPPLSNAI